MDNEAVIIQLRPHRRMIGALLGLFTIVLLFGDGCRKTSGQQHQKPNVILILIDALRADHLGCYGYPRPTSPVIDALASDSAVFDSAFANANWTKPSIPSLFTGLYPIQHQVFTGNTLDTSGRLTSDILNPRFRTMAEAFKSIGYSTGAFLNNAQIRSYLGFNQGFDVYEEELGSAVHITDTFLRWVRDNSHRPFFSYLHYLDVHWPYRPPAAFSEVFQTSSDSTIDFNGGDWRMLQDQIRSGEIKLTAADLQAMKDLYDGGIRFTDAAIGQLLAALRLLNLDQDTIILITADHGEEFLEHGGVGHGYTLYDEVLRVPLIMHVPGIRPRRISAEVQLVDVVPTLVDFVKIPAATGLSGISLRPLLSGSAAAAARAVVSEHRSRQWKESIRFGRYKLIRTFVLPVSHQKQVTPPLRAGMWLKVKGLQHEAGTFIALKVEQMEPQQGIRFAGQLSHVVLEKGRFQILGISCRFSSKTSIEDENGRELEQSLLKDGSWWSVKGKFDENKVFVVKEGKILSNPDDREPIIRAPVEKVLQDENGLKLHMIGLTLSFNKATDFVGRWPAGVEKTESEEANLQRSFADLCKLRVLRSLELYDLLQDPHEKQNLATQSPAVAQDLSHHLDAWEKQYAPKDAAAEQKTLDEETVNRLRALGYVQ